MDAREIAEFTGVNRRAWSAIAPTRGAHLQSGERFAQGIASFDIDELPVDDWSDLDVVHLMCASGEDTLTLALAGARVTGVDIAAENIDHARRKAEISGLDARFVVADVYDLPADLAGAFDVVFLNSGGLGWLPDIDRWAEIVATTLRPGGRVLIDEIHPLAICLSEEDGRYDVIEDYFRRGRPQWNAAGPPGLDGTDADDVMPSTVEFRWPIGDVVTALARAGMRIEVLREYAKGDERLPAGFILLARRD